MAKKNKPKKPSTKPGPTGSGSPSSSNQTTPASLPAVNSTSPPKQANPVDSSASSGLKLQLEPPILTPVTIEASESQSPKANLHYSSNPNKPPLLSKPQNVQDPAEKWRDRAKSKPELIYKRKETRPPSPTNSGPSSPKNSGHASATDPRALPPKDSQTLSQKLSSHLHQSWFRLCHQLLLEKLLLRFALPAITTSSSKAPSKVTSSSAIVFDYDVSNGGLHVDRVPTSYLLGCSFRG
ncbi:hypothetical protein Bca101_061505 [Brassica carinata]